MLLSYCQAIGLKAALLSGTGVPRHVQCHEQEDRVMNPEGKCWDCFFPSSGLK